jgi:type IV secretory pathway TrbF-like protein
MSFFSKKTGSKAEHDAGTTGLSPYVAAQLKWDERYGDWIVRAKNWRIAGVFDVNYFSRLATIIFPARRQLQSFPKRISLLHWC